MQTWKGTEGQYPLQANSNPTIATSPHPCGYPSRPCNGQETRSSKRYMGIQLIGGSGSLHQATWAGNAYDFLSSTQVPRPWGEKQAHLDQEQRTVSFLLLCYQRPPNVSILIQPLCFFPQFHGLGIQGFSWEFRKLGLESSFPGWVPHAMPDTPFCSLAFFLHEAHHGSCCLRTVTLLTWRLAPRGEKQTLGEGPHPALTQCPLPHVISHSGHGVHQDSRG